MIAVKPAFRTCECSVGSIVSFAEASVLNHGKDIVLVLGLMTACTAA